MEYKELRSIAVDFAYYLAQISHAYSSHEKQKEIFDDWFETKQNSHKHSIVRPASDLSEGGELLKSEAGEKGVSGDNLLGLGYSNEQREKMK